MPHPLVFDAHVKVETVDRNVDPIQAFDQALKDLKAETELLERAFKHACDEYSPNF
jgi:DNA-directed RNA polymerase subunit L